MCFFMSAFITIMNLGVDTGVVNGWEWDIQMICSKCEIPNCLHLSWHEKIYLSI